MYIPKQMYMYIYTHTYIYTCIHIYPHLVWFWIFEFGVQGPGRGACSARLSRSNPCIMNTPPSQGIGAVSLISDGMAPIPCGKSYS